LTRAGLRTGLCIIVSMSAVLWSGLVSASGVAELKEELKQQDEHISTLEERLRALEGDTEARVPRQVVEAIDQRIIDFEDSPSSNGRSRAIFFTFLQHVQ
jgi:hypothetical protein